MSATAETTRFAGYLGNCPILHIPGRTYPVVTHFLDDILYMTGKIQLRQHSATNTYLKHIEYRLERNSRYAIREYQRRGSVLRLLLCSFKIRH